MPNALEKQNEELRKQLQGTVEKLKAQDALLKALTSLPLEIFSVVAINKEEVWISRSGELTAVAPRPELNLKIGDGVLVQKETMQVMRAVKGQLMGLVARVKSNESGRPIELDNGFPVLGTRVEVEAGDRVVLDRSGQVILKNLGKKEEQFVFDENLNVTWEDIGGLSKAKEVLREAIEYPVIYADLFRYYNKKPIKGVLLEGPPGNGKTLLAKALTNSIAKHYGKAAYASSFIYCKGPEILSKYVSVAEETIRGLFRQANEHYQKHQFPGVIFIDEAESILNKRGSGISSDIERTIVPTFLAEMDGLSDSGTLVVLATNRPEKLDSAVVRDGRIDRRINIPRPNKTDAHEIFKIHLRQIPTEKAVDEIVNETIEELYAPEKIVLKARHKTKQQEIPLTLGQITSGAMISGIVGRATSKAIQECIVEKKEPQGLNLGHMVHAIHETLFSMTNIDLTEELREVVGPISPNELEIIKLKYAATN